MFALFKKISGLNSNLVLIYYLHLITGQPPQIEAQGVHGYSEDDLFRKVVSIRAERYGGTTQFFGNGVLLDCVLRGIGLHCTPERRTIIRYQVALELRYDTHSAPCQNTANQRRLRNPPPLRPLDTDLNPEYADWLNSLLLSNERFCHPLKNLHCSTTTSPNVCACYAGSEWNAGASTCTFLPGSPCEFNPAVFTESDVGKTPVYYQPLTSLTGFGYRTESVSGLLCAALGNPCRRPAYYLDAYCLNDTSISEAQARVQHFQRNSNRRHGDNCDPAQEQALLTLSIAERPNFEARRHQLAVFQADARQFCNPAAFLTCRAAVGICDCMTPTTFNSSLATCTLPPPYDECGKFKDIEAIKNESVVHEAKEWFAKAFEDHAATCDGRFHRCLLDDLAHVTEAMEMDCTCPAGSTGRLCTEVLTRFLTRTRPTTFPRDVPKLVDKWQVFSAMNENARYLEGLKRQNERQFCPLQFAAIGRRAERLIRGLDTAPRTTRLTTKFYDDVNATIEQIRAAAPSNWLCNSFDGLQCAWRGQRPVDETSGGSCYGDVTFLELADYLVARVDKLPCGAPCDPNSPSTPAQFNSAAGVESLEDLFVTGEVAAKFCGKFWNSNVSSSCLPAEPNNNASWSCSCPTEGGSGGGGTGTGTGSGAKSLNAQLSRVFLLTLALSGVAGGLILNIV